jgi:hypothetical protein
MRITFTAASLFTPVFGEVIDRTLDKHWKAGVVDLQLASHQLTFEAVMVIIVGENTELTADFYNETNKVHANTLYLSLFSFASHRKCSRLLMLSTSVF